LTPALCCLDQPIPKGIAYFRRDVVLRLARFWVWVRHTSRPTEAGKAVLIVSQASAQRLELRIGSKGKSRSQSPEQGADPAGGSK
jgi:hypothetical protein